MRSTALILVLFTMSLAACGGPPPPEDEPTTVPTSSAVPARIASSPSETDWDDRAVFREGLIEAEREVLDRLPGATVYLIDLQIPDDFLVLQGHEEVRYTKQEDEPLEEVYFRLFPNGARAQRCRHIEP